MKLVADESVDQPIVTRLRADGHQVWYVADVEPALPDDRLLREANSQQALLLTTDKDFGELVFRQRLVTSGVLLLRLAGLSPESKAGVVSRVLRDHGAELCGSFSVITPGSLRIRHDI
jgi:predicted nuclease of predicted toxin-antitoxin system